MDSDDMPVGRILSRREIMQVFGAAFLVGSGSWAVRQPTSAVGKTVLPPCIVRPEQTEGPFFADLELERSDIRTEPSTGTFQPGLPLELIFQVSRVGNEECAPLPGARVDIWQCDAVGRYSAFQDRSAGGDLREENFLRGYQLTDESGTARFMTIYPGWYRGGQCMFISRSAPRSARTELTSSLRSSISMMHCLIRYMPSRHMQHVGHAPHEIPMMEFFGAQVIT